MKGEINIDFYCVRYDITDGGFKNKPEPCANCKKVCEQNLVGIPYKEAKAIYDGYEYCKHRHRKWPTPQQFKEEYGKDYQEKGAVWLYKVSDFIWEDTDEPIEIYSWELMALCTAKYYKQHYSNTGSIVCACTPWGEPDKDWRP